MPTLDMPDFYATILDRAVARPEPVVHDKTLQELLHFDHISLDPYPPSDDLVLSDCLVGVEVELNRIDIDIPYYWKSVHEGSLHDNGREYVLNSPKYGQGLVEALSILEAAITNAHPLINNDTSTHIHINVRDLTPKELVNFILLYAIYEKVIFGIAKRRKNNIFCLPLYKTSGIHDNVSAIIQYSLDGNYSELQYSIENLNRYSAVNIASVVSLGTLEFRLFEATYKADKLLMYINILQSLKAKAVAIQDSECKPYNIFRGNSIYEVTRDIFGEYTDVLFSDTFYEDIFVGLQTAKHLRTLATANYTNIFGE